MKQWFFFFLTIIKHGNLFQSLNDLSSESISLWRKPLLKTPILCQLISLASIYRQNKQWPCAVYHCDEKKLAFVIINKNASTSILSSLLQVENPDVNCEEISVKEVHELSKVKTMPHVAIGYESFVVLRNPKDRLISCYYDQVKDRDQTNYFSHLYFGIFHKDLTFDQFVELVAKIPDSIKESHFRVQIHCVPNIKDLKVFKMDNMNNEIIPYLSKHGMSMVRQNQYRDKKNDSISSRTESLIKSIYKEDYEAFAF